MCIKGGHIQIVALNCERSCKVVANHAEPVHLFLGELLARPGVTIHDPSLEVLPDPIRVAGQCLVEAAYSPDEGNKRC